MIVFNINRSYKKGRGQKFFGAGISSRKIFKSKAKPRKVVLTKKSLSILRKLGYQLVNNGRNPQLEPRYYNR